MFENCSTMAELVEARVNKIKEGKDKILAINREYEDRKRELISKTEEYRKIPFHRYSGEPPQKFMGIPYAGESGRLLKLEYTQGGFAI